MKVNLTKLEIEFLETLIGTYKTKTDYTEQEATILKKFRKKKKHKKN